MSSISSLTDYSYLTVYSSKVIPNEDKQPAKCRVTSSPPSEDATVQTTSQIMQQLPEQQSSSSSSSSTSCEDLGVNYNSLAKLELFLRNKNLPVPEFTEGERRILEEILEAWPPNSITVTLPVVLALAIYEDLLSLLTADSPFSVEEKLLLESLPHTYAVFLQSLWESMQKKESDPIQERLLTVINPNATHNVQNSPQPEKIFITALEKIIECLAKLKETESIVEKVKIWQKLIMYQLDYGVSFLDISVFLTKGSKRIQDLEAQIPQQSVFSLNQIKNDQLTRYDPPKTTKKNIDTLIKHIISFYIRFYSKPTIEKIEKECNPIVLLYKLNSFGHSKAKSLDFLLLIRNQIEILDLRKEKMIKRNKEIQTEAMYLAGIDIRMVAEKFLEYQNTMNSIAFYENFYLAISQLNMLNLESNPHMKFFFLRFNVNLCRYSNLVKLINTVGKTPLEIAFKKFFKKYINANKQINEKLDILIRNDGGCIRCYKLLEPISLHFNIGSFTDSLKNLHTTYSKQGSELYNTGNSDEAAELKAAYLQLSLDAIEMFFFYKDVNLIKTKQFQDGDERQLSPELIDLLDLEISAAPYDFGPLEQIPATDSPSSSSSSSSSSLPSISSASTSPLPSSSSSSSSSSLPSISSASTSLLSFSTSSSSFSSSSPPISSSSSLLTKKITATAPASTTTSKTKKLKPTEVGLKKKEVVIDTSSIRRGMKRWKLERLLRDLGTEEGRRHKLFGGVAVARNGPTVKIGTLKGIQKRVEEKVKKGQL